MQKFSSNLSVAGNLTVVGDLQYDDVSADSAFLNVAIGNNLTADECCNFYSRNWNYKCRPTIY